MDIASEIKKNVQNIKPYKYNVKFDPIKSYR